ncbi:hypothetical protein DL767_008534 [Monosporascus sp. MG133]|nr:hypothetical protein DL767_008534 [Monosporascus sp. MG133]
MLLGRCIQGVGGGGIHSLSLVIQTDFLPLRWRPKWYGVTCRPLSSDLAAQEGQCAGEDVEDRLIGRVHLHRLGDSLSYRRLVGGTQHAWDSAATLAPLIIGLLGIVATVLYEAFLAKHPFLRKELFHDISSVTTYIAAALQGLMLYGTLYYPLDTGVALLPNLLTFAVSGSITGRLVTRFNNFRWAIWIGWLVGSVGPAMYIVWRINDSTPIWVIAFLLGGIGHGAILTAQNFAAQAMCKPGDEGAAAAMYIFSRQFGMAVGVGIGATTFQNVMKSRLAEDGLPTEIAENAETYIPVLHSLPEGPRRNAIFDAYRFGLQMVYATWLAISVVTLFFCLVFIKHADMNRKLSSEHHLDSERMVRHWGRKEPQSDAEK